MRSIIAFLALLASAALASAAVVCQFDQQCWTSTTRPACGTYYQYGYNSTTDSFEWCNGSTWVSAGTGRQINIAALGARGDTQGYNDGTISLSTPTKLTSAQVCCKVPVEGIFSDGMQISKRSTSHC